MRNRIFFCVLATLLSMAGLARGQGAWDFGAGYSRLSVDVGNGEDHSGWGMVLRWCRPIAENTNGARMFFALRTSYYPGGDAFENAIWNVWMLTPEIGLAWYQQLSDSGLFLEPSVAVGAPIAT